MFFSDQWLHQLLVRQGLFLLVLCYIQEIFRTRCSCTLCGKPDISNSIMWSFITLLLRLLFWVKPQIEKEQFQQSLLLWHRPVVCCDYLDFWSPWKQAKQHWVILMLVFTCVFAAPGTRRPGYTQCQQSCLSSLTLWCLVWLIKPLTWWDNKGSLFSCVFYQSGLGHKDPAVKRSID